jgi:hypothetical protein
VADFWAKILVPAAAALTLLAIATNATREVDDDLHLVAPDLARAGQSLPVRAQLYAGLHRPEGAQLITAPVELELRARSGQRLAHARMQPSYAHSMDAVLTLPQSYEGEARLTAHARLDAATPSSERVLEIKQESPAELLTLHERPLSPLQRFAAGPVRVRSEQPAPNALSLVITGGACVPEQPCELWLYVGSPAASVHVLATPAATPDPQSAHPSEPTDGVVHLRAVTHGPEAELAIVAERAGTEVATRSFRLAVALGANVASEQPRIFDAPARPQIGLRSDEGGCIIDAFLERRWLRTGSLRDCRDHEPLPFDALEPGLWRLQLRRDPFSGDSAAVRSIYVRQPGEPAAHVLSRLASAALDQSPDDALARAVRNTPEAYAAALDDTAGYLLASLDSGIIALPAPASGYPMAMLQLQLARAKLRKLALFALLLCALTLGLIVAQRGLVAASEAAHVMAEAGAEPPELDRQRLRSTLRVLATVSSLLLAFVAIAVYMVARSQGP